MLHGSVPLCSNCLTRNWRNGAALPMITPLVLANNRLLLLQKQLLLLLLLATKQLLLLLHMQEMCLCRVVHMLPSLTIVAATSMLRGSALSPMLK
jgi:hypothetical protein